MAKKKATKKLFVLLGRLSKKEVQEFDSYLRSGLAKAQPRDLHAWEKLYQELQKQKLWEADALEKNVGNLAPENRRVRSSLILDLQNFMVYLRFRTQTGLQHLLLLQTMKHPETEKFVEAIFKKTDQQLGKKSIASLQLSHAIQDEMIAFNAHNSDRTPLESLTFAQHTFDAYFIGQKLKYSCAIINQRRILVNAAPNLELPLLKGLILYLEQLENEGRQGEYDPLIWMYLEVYRLLTQTDDIAEMALQRLLNLLDQHQNEYQEEELYDLYTFALNYCIRMINQKASRDHFLICKSIYEHLLESRLIMDSEGQFPVFHFKNITVLMARQGEFDWVSQFISRYAPMIAPDAYKVAHKFALGLLAFYKEDFSTSFQYFEQVLSDSGDIFLGLDARIYHLRTHYMRRKEDSTWFGSLEHSIAAFRMALGRRSEKIAATHKENYGNFARELNVLARHSAQPTAPDVTALERARQELDSKDNVADKTWLLEQYDLLIEKARG